MSGFFQPLRCSVYLFQVPRHGLLRRPAMIIVMNWPNIPFGTHRIVKLLGDVSTRRDKSIRHELGVLGTLERLPELRATSGWKLAIIILDADLELGRARVRKQALDKLDPLEESHPRLRIAFVDPLVKVGKELAPHHLHEEAHFGALDRVSG